jgi:hypothetical protein
MSNKEISCPLSFLHSIHINIYGTIYMTNSPTPPCPKQQEVFYYQLDNELLHQRHSWSVSISLYNKTIMLMHQTQCTNITLLCWIQAVLTLLVGGSISNSLLSSTVIIFSKNVCSWALLKTCIFYFPNVTTEVWIKLCSIQFWSNPLSEVFILYRST